MNPVQVCARCGAELRFEGGTCPRCLLRLAVPTPTPAEEQSAASPSRAPRARAVAPPIETIAAAFPDYEVIELLGLGGMGAVYKARHKKLDRVVALKILPREISSDRALAERFLREARALAKLAHRNIVAVHELGESGGFPYLALEYVDGLNLRALLREKKLEPRQTLAIVKELCDALQYAHDEGIVHRDIKPENVLVDRRGRVKIADFGLAKLVGAVDDGFRTQADIVMGTPHYMAPEQLEHPRDVDHRADLYALGVVLYEMLTGSLPRGNFELPSARVQVDVRLDEVVLKALEREPARRYQHAVDVKTDVEATETPAKPANEGAATSDDEILARGGISIGGDDPSARLIGLHVNWKGARFVVPDLEQLKLNGRGVAWMLALWLGYWVWLAVGWNSGPFLLGLVLAVGGALALFTARRVARAALTVGRSHEISGGALAALGLACVLIGQVAAWERGLFARYQPPPLSVGTALVDSARAVANAPDVSGFEPDELRRFPIRVRRSFDTDVPNGLFRVGPAVWLIAGVVSMWLGILIACWSSSRAAWSAVAAASAASCVSCAAYVVLWVCVWIASDDARLDPPKASFGSFGSSMNRDPLAEQVRGRLVAAELSVHGEGSAEIAPRDATKKPLFVTTFLAGPSSPLDRWKFTWRGPACAAPRYAITIVGRDGEGASKVQLYAGLFADDRDGRAARATAEAFFESFTREIGGS